MSGAAPALVLAAAGVGIGHAIMPDHWVPLAVVGRTRRYPLGRVARLSGAAGLAHVLVSLLLGAAIIVVGLQFKSTIEHAQSAIVGGVLITTGLVFAALELGGLGHGHGHSHSAGGHSRSGGGQSDAGHGHPHEEHIRDHPDHAHPHAEQAYPHAEQAHPHAEQVHPRAEHVEPHQAHAHQHQDHTHPHAEPTQAHTDRRGLRGLAGIVVPFGAAASPDLTILPVFLAASAAGAGAAIGSLLAFAVATVATIVGLTLLATVGGYRLRGAWLDRWANLITAVTLVLIGLLVATGVI